MGAVGRGLEEIDGELVAAWARHFDDFDGRGCGRRKPWMKRAGRFESWKLVDDVALDGWRGCGGGEGDDGGGAKGGEKVSEGAVVGAKIVAPGGDAVGLVDGDEGGLAFGEHLGKAGDAHALGCNEEELEGAVEVVAAGLAGFVAGEAGVDAAYAEAGDGEFGCLVVHERDEGGDDEGGASASDGGELVTEGFACACGHDEEDVAAIGGGTADCFLIGAKGGEAEGLVEEGFEVHATGSVSHVLRLWAMEEKWVRWLA